MLTPQLQETWTKGPIVSRLFVGDMCEEIIAGHLDKVFVQARQGPTTWKLVDVRPANTPKPTKNKRQARYGQYE